MYAFPSSASCNYFLTVDLDSMYTLYPIFAQDDHPTLFYGFSACLVFVVVAYLSYPRSLAYRRITCATALSLASYIAWLGCIIYSHSNGLLQPKGGLLGSADIWPGLGTFQIFFQYFFCLFPTATIAFAFCSSSTLPLYSSLKSAAHPTSGSKVPVSRSFRFLSTSSAILAVLLLLPSIIFAAFPNRPAPVSVDFLCLLMPYVFQSSNLIQDPLNSTLNISLPYVILDLNATVPILDSHRPSPPEFSLLAVRIHKIISILSATTLILSIPSILVSIPPLRIPSLRSVKFNISRVIIILFVMICGLIPPFWLENTSKSKNDDYFLKSSGIFGFVVLIVLVMAFMGTYFMPTFLHVSQHFFKRPLAIVVPRMQPSQSSPEVDELGAGPSESASHRTPLIPRFHDELLLRKERALQKKQLRKRIAWDVGVWVLLLTSLAGLIGYGGYLTGTR